MYTLKVNIRAQEERERREKERQTREAISKIQSSSGPPTRARRRKGLNFHQPGTFVAQGDQLRKKARREALQKKVAAKIAGLGIADAAKLAALTTAKITEKATTNISKDKTISALEPEEEQVPVVEWWDKPILGNKSLEEVIPKLVQKCAKPEELFCGITNLVEHPPIKDPPAHQTTVAQVPIFLTKKEHKKLRRQNRKNRELEKQEKIKLGLVPKPEPKLKRSSIMYALGDEAITNPSLANQMVKEQEEKRLQAHLEHNESKKLTAEEKRMKKLRKVQDDLSVTGLWASVYRILVLERQSIKLKTVEQKAKQLLMTGTIILHKDINLVVVEGGPKAQRKFKRLVLNRLRWSEHSTEMGPGTIESNRCYLLWEGQVNARAFNFLKVKQFNDESEARKYFREFNVEHYWDLAFRTSILESIEDT